MKNKIFTLVLFLLSINGFSQNSKYEFGRRFTPSIKNEKINEAKYVSEIMPQFCRYFSLPSKDRALFEDQVKIADSHNEGYVYHLYSQESFFPEENYEKVIDFVSVEISAVCQGKNLKSQCSRKTLTPEQKNILNSADLGTDIRIKIKFKYKYQAIEDLDNGSKVREGEYIVTVVPETEAEYPGGFKQMTEYIKKNIINKIPEKGISKKIQQAVLEFTVNEEGQIIDTKISSTSTDPKIDKLILDATNKMPKWKPAQNSKGVKVKEEFSIQFGGGGC